MPLSYDTFDDDEFGKEEVVGMSTSPPPTSHEGVVKKQGVVGGGGVATAGSNVVACSDAMLQRGVSSFHEEFNIVRGGAKDAYNTLLVVACCATILILAALTRIAQQMSRIEKIMMSQARITYMP